MTNDNFGAILDPFLPKFVLKPILLEKWALSVFKSSNYLSWCNKSEKTCDPFLRKIPNWHMDKETDRQRLFLGPSIGLGSKKTFYNVGHTSQPAKYLHFFVVRLLMKV